MILKIKAYCISVGILIFLFIVSPVLLLADRLNKCMRNNVSNKSRILPVDSVR